MPRIDATMELSPLTIATLLREEAEEILFGRGVDGLFQKQGAVFYAGSYALDLMAWTDIDLCLVIHEGIDPNRAAGELATEFILMEESARVRFDRSLHKKRPELPVGLSLGVKLDIGNHKTPWKLDIWIVDEEVRNRTRKTTEEIQKLLTPSSRKSILEWKHRLITPEGRTPSLSGYWLYQAILVHKMKGETEILQYLQANGVKLLSP